ncbi:MAG TPA: hypothetical protein VF614_13520 [Chthoniobacteraceae bacterium]
MSAQRLQALPDPTPPAPAIVALPNPPPATTAAPAAKRGPLNLGSLGLAKPKAKKSEDRPVVPANEELAELADQYAREKPQFDALEGSIKSTRLSILHFAFPAWLSAGQTQPDVSSLHVFGSQPDTKLLVSVQNRYPSQVEFGAGQEAILAVIGRDGEDEAATQARFDEAFEAGLSISLKFGEIPVENRQAVIDDLLPIFEKHGLLTPAAPAAEDAEGEVSAAVVCKQIVQPKPGFHARRHALFTLEENLRLQEILPAVGMVKVTGLKK